MTSSVLNEVHAERFRQDEQWGEQNHRPPVWLAILGEEFGEVAKEVAEATAGGLPLCSNYRNELIQVAAVAVAAVEAFDRGKRWHGE